MHRPALRSICALYAMFTNTRLGVSPMHLAVTIAAQDHAPALAGALARVCSSHGDALDCLREDLSCLQDMAGLGGASLEALVGSWMTGQRARPAGGIHIGGGNLLASLKDQCRTCGELDKSSSTAATFKRCSRCKAARYCCTDHQRRDWPRHKHVCRQPLAL